jgi:hypothetical protein
MAVGDPAQAVAGTVATGLGEDPGELLRDGMGFDHR